jgi:hypothetical protein
MKISCLPLLQKCVDSIMLLAVVHTIDIDVTVAVTVAACVVVLIVVVAVIVVD